MDTTTPFCDMLARLRRLTPVGLLLAILPALYVGAAVAPDGAQVSVGSVPDRDVFVSELTFADVTPPAAADVITLARNATVRDSVGSEKGEPCLLHAALGDVVYVSADAGSDTSGIGTEASPWRTIGFAMERVAPCADADRPFTIQLAPGDYEEKVVLGRYVTIAGADPDNPDATRIFPKSDANRGDLQSRDSVILAPEVMAGENAIHDLTVMLETDAPEGIALLKVRDVQVDARNVVFNGASRPGSIAVDISFPGSSMSRFEKCLFTGVENAVLAVNTGANFTRNTFEDIQGAAIVVRPPLYSDPATALNPLLGDQNNIQGSGLNTFVMASINGGAGLVIDTGVTATGTGVPDLLAHSNNWAGAATREDIAERVSANVQIDSRVGGGGILTTTLVVEVSSSANGAPIENATVTLVDIGSQTVNVNGVYVFAALPSGQYEVAATADGFVEGTATVNANNSIESIALALVPEAGSGDLGAIAQSLLDQFSLADVDGDGGLSLAEAQAVEPSLTLFLFVALDTNSDGRLSAQELSNFLAGGEGGGEGETPPPAGCAFTKSDVAGTLHKWLGELFLGGLVVLTLTGYGYRVH